jgi:hypothetical protein
MIHPAPTGRSATKLEPLDGAIDHIRGGAGGHVILEYGDYECPTRDRRTTTSSASRDDSAMASGSHSVTFH